MTPFPQQAPAPRGRLFLLPYPCKRCIPMARYIFLRFTEERNMRTRRFKTTPDYATGLRHARGVFRRFKATRRAFAEQIALEYLAELKRSGSYTQTIKVHGKDVTFDLADFIPSGVATLQNAQMDHAMISITLPFEHSAEADEAFLIGVQTDLDYRRIAMTMAITTYYMQPHVLIAAAIRMKAAVLTAHWKHPVGLKVTKVQKPINKKEAVHKPSDKIMARNPLYQADGAPAKETPA